MTIHRLSLTLLGVALMAASAGYALAGERDTEQPRAALTAFVAAVESGALTDAELAELASQRAMLNRRWEAIRAGGQPLSADQQEALRQDGIVYSATVRALAENGVRGPARSEDEVHAALIRFMPA
ncbi:hypothetical protein QU481_05975 [Crenobacter sp. SG2303]|uniref:Uncharacterized protein n=1 Tax=Crenobacter oryzisoli TaxID=3056844 RepID=A0ABT7XKX2_9NEIS|nr:MULTISPECIES: hypothetical protein [unclassified Crenobacter]MDN0074442.1 hypothetical protein [Crenobacter sp. SG2303]MDN0081301.1 hypothetical protein [Crenobacter sp. SG2305]